MLFETAMIFLKKFIAHDIIGGIRSLLVPDPESGQDRQNCADEKQHYHASDGGVESAVGRRKIDPEGRYRTTKRACCDDDREHGKSSGGGYAAYTDIFWFKRTLGFRQCHHNKFE